MSDTKYSYDLNTDGLMMLTAATPTTGGEEDIEILFLVHIDQEQHVWQERGKPAGKKFRVENNVITRL